MNSDFDFDPENGSRTSKLARGAIFAQFRGVWKLGQNEVGGYKRGPSVIFTIHLSFCDLRDLVSGPHSIMAQANIPLHRHRFERSRLHNRPGRYGLPVSNHFFVVFSSVCGLFRTF